MIWQLRDFPKSFYLQERLASNFSLKYHPWVTHEGDKNKWNDHQLKKLLIVQQILFVRTLGKV